MCEGGRPVLVAFSGIDGSGKSTLIEGAVERLAEVGRSAVRFRALAAEEPFLRALRLVADEPAGERAQTFITEYLGWRLVTNSRTALEEGRQADFVLADRFVLDHWANQLAFGAELDALRWVGALAPEADLTVLVDVPAELAWQRVTARDDGPGWQDQAFLRRAAAAFETCVSEVPGGPVLRIDGTLAPEELADRIGRAAQELRRAP